MYTSSLKENVFDDNDVIYRYVYTYFKQILRKIAQLKCIVI